MAKFIKVTEIKRGTIAINLDIIEVMTPSANGGTELISITHHTKYTVKESMDDILRSVDNDEFSSPADKIARYKTEINILEKQMESVKAIADMLAKHYCPSDDL